jgi:hypothetical protein
MPIKKPQPIIGFRYVGTSPVTIIGLGDLNQDDFVGSEVLVPVERTGDTGQGTKNEGGES